MHITNENAHKTFIIRLAAGVHWLRDSMSHAKGAAVMSADMVAKAAQFAIPGRDSFYDACPHHHHGFLHAFVLLGWRHGSRGHCLFADPWRHPVETIAWLNPCWRHAAERDSFHDMVQPVLQC